MNVIDKVVSMKERLVKQKFQESLMRKLPMKVKSRYII